MADPFEQALRIHLWADVHAPKSARQLVRQLDWLPAPATKDAALVASELVSNAVAQAARAEADSIELTLSRAAQWLMIEAEPARLFSGQDRVRAAKTILSERNAHSGVLALAVVDGVADDWGIVDGNGWASLRI